MNIRKLPPLFLLSAMMVSRLPAAPDAPGAELNIAITANDSMKFSVTRIEAHPGQVIRVELLNQGTLPKEVMGHNWILLKAGQDAAAYAATAIAVPQEGYQPKSRAGDVLASIPLVGPKKSGEVTFTAPTVPGHYPYLCTFPAHYQAGMKGELIVK